MAFKGKYPIFKDKRVTLSNVTEIINYLRQRGYNADYGLTEKMRSESYAFSNMLALKLRPVLEYLFFVDRRNYEELFAPWFIRNMPAPFNYVYPRQSKTCANDLIESLYPEACNSDVIQAYITNIASECFSTLAVRLGKKDFFNGSAPSSLDAAVYSYLAPLAKIPFPTKDIPNLLQNFPELMEYVKRIDDCFFPGLPGRDEIYNRAEEISKTKKEEDLAAASFKTKLFAGLFVFAAMFGYAVSKNIISVSSLRSARALSG